MPVEQTASGVSCDLIRAVQRGDRGAFETLAQVCRKRMMGTIARMIARPEDVEDVAQEAFLRMYHCIGQLQVPQAFDLWAYRLTTNATYDYLRKRPRRREIRMGDLLEREIAAVDEIAAGRSVSDERHRLRTLDCVGALLEQLSSSDRILVVMREVEGLKIGEIASVLGISMGAVKVRLFRARNRMRGFLKPEDPPSNSEIAPALAAGRV